jgi:uncharacterized delta-60 repeat protein
MLPVVRSLPLMHSPSSHQSILVAVLLSLLISNVFSAGEADTNIVYLGQSGTIDAIREDVDGTLYVLNSNRFFRLPYQSRYLNTIYSVVGPFSAYDFIKLEEGSFLVGGDFQKDGRSYLMRTKTGSAVSEFFLHPDPDQPVYSIAALPDGRVLIGGAFTSLGGYQRGGIARLFLDGTVDGSFNPGKGASLIRKIVLQSDGKILALTNGSFDGKASGQLVRLNPGGSVDETFSTLGSPFVPYNILDFKLLPDGRITIGGQFQDEDGVPHHGIARLMPDGKLDPSFDPGTGSDNSVLALDVYPDGRVIIAGLFQEVNGVSCPGVARLLADGSVDSTFDAKAAPGYFRAVEIQYNGDIYVAGNLSTFGKQGNKIVRLFGDGPIVPPKFYSQPTNQSVREGATIMLNVPNIPADPITYTWWKNGMPVEWSARLSYQANGVLLIQNVQTNDSGSYTLHASNALGTAISEPLNLTVIPSAPSPGGLDIHFATLGTNRYTRAVAILVDGKYVVAGGIDQNSSINAGELWRFMPDGSPDPGFNFGKASGWISAVLPDSEDKLLIFGNFTNVMGNSVNRMARLHTDGSFDDTFDPGSGANGTIVTAKRDNEGRIWMAGTFSQVHGVASPLIARLNSDGTRDAAFSPALISGTVLCLYPDSRGGVLIGGVNLTFNGQSRPGIGRLNGDGSLDTNYVPNVASAAVSAIVPGPQDTVYLGRQPSGDPLPVVRLKEDGLVDTNFVTSGRVTGWIYAAAPTEDGGVMVGGDIAYVSAYPMHIGKFRIDGSLDTTFEASPGPDGIVRNIERLPNGDFLLTGTFRSYNGLERLGIARIYGGTAQPSGPRILQEPTAPATSCGIEATMTVQAIGTPPLKFQWFRNGMALTDVAGIQGAQTNILLLHKSHPAQNGVYTVEISDRYGSVRSSNVNVRIDPLPIGRPIQIFKAPPFSYGNVSSMARDAEGKLLICGENIKPTVARLNADGTLDSTFKPPAELLDVTKIVVQEDGKILAVGYFPQVENPAHLVRLLSTGQLDPDFKPDTRYTVSDVGVQPDGKIVVARLLGSFEPDVKALERLLPNGELDRSFDAQTFASHVWSIVLQPGGKVLARDSFLGRYQTNGLVDPTFSGVGDLDDYAVDFANRILISHVLFSSDGVIRYLDGKSGTDVSFKSGRIDSRVTRIIPLVHGDILVYGKFAWIQSRRVPTFAHLLENGSLDVRFLYDAGLFEIEALSTFLAETDGTLLLAGKFRDVNELGDIVRLKMEQHPPAIIRNPSSVTGSVGSSVSLNVLVSVTPEKLYFSWRKNGIEIAGATNDVLTLSGITSESAGAYTVVVSNGSGAIESASANIKVTTSTPPVRMKWSFNNETIGIEARLEDGSLPSGEQANRLRVETSTNLVDWVELPENLVDAAFNLPIIPVNAAQFFRMKMRSE